MLKEEIREIIQDNTWEDVDSPQTLIDEQGINRAVRGILSLLRERGINIDDRNWKLIGKNKDGEDIYENRDGKKAIEKDHSHLVSIGGKIIAEKYKEEEKCQKSGLK